jgi:hypothetical protein
MNLRTKETCVEQDWMGLVQECMHSRGAHISGVQPCDKLVTLSLKPFSIRDYLPHINIREINKQVGLMHHGSICFGYCPLS